MTRNRSDIVEISGEIRAEGRKAILFFDGARETWLPKSQIDIREINSRGLVEVSMPEWLARDKGLI